MSAKAAVTAIVSPQVPSRLLEKLPELSLGRSGHNVLILRGLFPLLQSEGRGIPGTRLRSRLAELIGKKPLGQGGVLKSAASPIHHLACKSNQKSVVLGARAAAAGPLP